MNQEKLIKFVETIALLIIIIIGSRVLFVLFLTPILAMLSSALFLNHVTGSTTVIDLVKPFIIQWTILCLILIDALLLYIVCKRWRKLNDR